MNKVKKSVVVSLLLTLVVCLSTVSCKKQEKKSTDAVLKTVDVLVVKKEAFTQELRAYGHVISKKTTPISAEQPGTINKIYMKAGDYVKKGGLLFGINSQKEKADLAIATSRLQLAKQDFMRHRQLMASKSISNQALEESKASYEQAKSALTQAQTEYSFTTVVAPYNGYLTEKKVTEGEYVARGTVLVNLISLNDLKVTYQVSDDEVARLRVGQHVKIKLGSTIREELTGYVSFISHVVNPKTKTITIEADFTNPRNYHVLPGMFVQVTQVIDDKKQIIRLPEESVLGDSEGLYVYTVAKSHVHKAYVHLGASDAGKVVILAGIRVGDKVVLSPSNQLSNGEKIAMNQP